jgi:hypothetical protein
VPQNNGDVYIAAIKIKHEPRIKQNDAKPLPPVFALKAPASISSPLSAD